MINYALPFANFRAETGRSWPTGTIALAGSAWSVRILLWNNYQRTVSVFQFLSLFLLTVIFLALFIKNINTLGSTKLSYFTNWSEWSVCDRHCTQNRVRRCREKKKCGTTILKVSSWIFHFIANIIIQYSIYIILYRKKELVNTIEKVDGEGASNINEEVIDKMINFTSFR